MAMFDSLPAKDSGGKYNQQTKALGQEGRNLVVGDTVQPFYSQADRERAYNYRYDYIPDFTFESGYDDPPIWEVRDGKLHGLTDHPLPIHFDHLGESIGTTHVDYVDEVDPEWLDVRREAREIMDQINNK